MIGQIRDGARGRAAAAFVPGEARARDAVADLAATLTPESQDPLLAVACIEALAKIGDPSADPPWPPQPGTVRRGSAPLP
jgi:HEAT repeat protein